jgi:FSR family fosmidomycin resistance protein-like MFS transporter
MTKSLPSSPQGSPRLAQLFSNLGHSYSHIFMLLYPTVVLALESELHMSYGELIALLTVGYVLFGVGALPAGWLGDRWSMVGMMLVFFFGLGASSILTGLMSTPLGIAVGLALIGVFASIYHPVGMAWLLRNAINPGRALGINGIFGSLGVAAAGLIAGVLTDLVSWRAAFVLPGVVAIGTGLAMALCVRMGRVAEIKADIHPRVESSRNDRVRAFIVLSVTMLCAGIMFQAISTALPKIFADRVSVVTGGTALGAGGLVSAVYLVAACAQVLGGHLADRYSPRAVYILSYMALAPLWFVAAYLENVALLVVVSTALFLNTSAVPVENVLLTRFSPSRWRGTAFGAKFVLALGVGALAVPMVAIIHELSGGFFWLFIVFASLSIAVTVAGLLLPRERMPVPAAVAPSAPGPSD